MSVFRFDKHGERRDLGRGAVVKMEHRMEEEVWREEEEEIMTFGPSPRRGRGRGRGRQSQPVIYEVGARGRGNSWESMGALRILSMETSTTVVPSSASLHRILTTFLLHQQSDVVRDQAYQFLDKASRSHIEGSGVLVVKLKLIFTTGFVRNNALA